MDLNKLLEEFIRERRYLKNITPKTETYYRDSWKAYVRFTGSTEISKAQLKEWVIKMREADIKPVSCNTWISGINAFCNWLFENEHLPERLKLSKLKVDEPGRKTINLEILRKLVIHKPKGIAQKRVHILLLLLIDTGVRIDEALTLTRQNVDFDNLLMKVMGKGRKERIIPISFKLRRALFKYLKTHNFDLVFCTRDGGKLSYFNIWRDYGRLCNAVKVSRKGAFHAFRHTFAYNYTKTFAKMSGDAENSLFYLQKQLGHTNLNTTRIYVDLQPEDLQEAHIHTSLLTKLK